MGRELVNGERDLLKQLWYAALRFAQGDVEEDESALFFSFLR